MDREFQGRDSQNPRNGGQAVQVANRLGNTPTVRERQKRKEERAAEPLQRGKIALAIRITR